MTIPLIWGSSWVVDTDTMSYDGGMLFVSYELWKTDIDNKKVENISEDLVGGSVNLDMTRDTFLAATFSLRNPWQVVPYVDYLAPYITLKRENGTIHSHKQMGLYCTRVSPASLDIKETTGDIEGADLCTVLAEDHFTSTWNIASGTNVITAVKAIVSSAGISRMNIPSTSKTLPSKKTFKIGGSKLAACNSLLHSIGFFKLCTNPNGFIHSPGPTHPMRLTQPWQTLNSDLIYGNVDVNPTNDRIANVVMVTNSDTNTAPLKSIRSNDDPSSPTSTVSLNRRIVKIEQMSGKVVQADLDARAEHLLAQGRSYYRTATVNVLPDSAGLECHQTIDLDFDNDDSDDLNSLSGRWWITGASMGFTPDSGLLTLTINQLTHRGLGIDI